MDQLISVVIPIGPDHRELSQRAIQSVYSQTIGADLIAIEDVHQRGPGWARNQGLGQVVTPYTLFLDADDWLEPHALERLLSCIRQYPSQYAYSDWYAGEVYQQAPETGGAWCAGKWHTISALIPTAWLEAVGGFDETLPGGEDTELYWHLGAYRYCGVRVPEALLHYSPEGERGRAFVYGPHYQSVMETIVRRHGGKMACCGQGAQPVPNGVEKLEGDVLAVALWGGNRRIVGIMSARVYPRSGNGKLLWVDPRDIQAMPEMFRTASPVEAMAGDPGMLDGIEAIAQAAQARFRPPAPPVNHRYEGQKLESRLDLDAIIQMGLERLD